MKHCINIEFIEYLIIDNESLPKERKSMEVWLRSWNKISNKNGDKIVFFDTKNWLGSLLEQIKKV